MSCVLVIDDSEIVNKMISEFLTSHGYEVFSAFNADKGYKLAQENHPDLIILDIQLPDVVGFEVCRLLRSHPTTRQVPVLMITATATQATDKVKGFQAGADDYLIKPFELTELLERVRAILRRSSAPATSNPVLLEKPQAVPEPKQPALSLRETLWELLLSPQQFPTTSAYPHVSLAFLVGLLTLVTTGLFSAPGTSWRPLMVCLLALLIWGVLVSVLVVACSLFGVHLRWKEGGRLLSLAGLPVLLKLAGGLILALVTSLSPFLFTASPALVWTSAPAFLFRLDAFELWSASLVWLLLRKRSDTAPRSAFLITALVWIVAAGLLMGIDKWGGSL